MDSDLLVAELLIRGFKHDRDDDTTCRKLYKNNEVAVVVRRNNALVAARFNSVEETLKITDYAMEKTNADTKDT